MPRVILHLELDPHAPALLLGGAPPPRLTPFGRWLREEVVFQGTLNPLVEVRRLRVTARSVALLLECRAAGPPLVVAQQASEQLQRLIDLRSSRRGWRDTPETLWRSRHLVVLAQPLLRSEPASAAPAPAGRRDHSWTRPRDRVR